MSCWTSTTSSTISVARREEVHHRLVVPRVDEADLEAGRQRVAVEVPGEVDLAPLAQALPEAGQRLVLRDEADRRAPRGRAATSAASACAWTTSTGVGAGDVAQVGHDLDLLLDVGDAGDEAGLAGARTPPGGGA